MVIAKKPIILFLMLLSGTMGYSHKEMATAPVTTANPSSPILFQVDFETGLLPSFLQKQISAPYALQIVNDPVYQGKKAARFELRAHDRENNHGKRAEILFPAPANDAGLERWYAFAVYFPEQGFEFDNSDEVICQWHQGGKATPSLCIRTKAGRIRLRVKSTIDSKEWIDLGAIEQNSWQYYILHIKHSSGPDGQVEIWRNGVQLANHSGANMYDCSSGIFHRPNWKLGIYKSAWNNASVATAGKRILYLDAIKIGDARASYADMTEPANTNSSQANASSARK
jgi:hypothetical protein